MISGAHGVSTVLPDPAEKAFRLLEDPKSFERLGAGELDVSAESTWVAGFVERIEERVERLAPGFRSSIVGRHVFAPSAMQAENPNLDLGAIGGGTAQLHQQLVFRPVPGFGRPETPVAGLYLASSSAHPGGGVHGAAGANAARAALLPLRRTRAAVIGRGLSPSTTRPTD